MKNSLTSGKYLLSERFEWAVLDVHESVVGRDIVANAVDHSLASVVGINGRQHGNRRAEQENGFK